MKAILIVSILLTLTSSNAFAWFGKESKQDAYLRTCKSTSFRILRAAKANAQKSDTELKKNADVICVEMKADIDKRSQWGTIKDPAFDSCIDAIDLIVNPGNDEAFRKDLRTQFCLDAK